MTGFARQRGFSLFEVLITVIVISIGLLGLAGLQFAALRASNNAQEYTMANLSAQDIEERIRAGDDYSALPPSGISDAAGNNIPILPNASLSPVTSAGNIYTITICWSSCDDSQTLKATFSP